MVIALAMDTFLLHSDLPADPLGADVIMQPRRRRDPLMAQAVAEANPGGSHRLLEAAGKAMDKQAEMFELRGLALPSRNRR